MPIGRGPSLIGGVSLACDIIRQVKHLNMETLHACPICDAEFNEELRVVTVSDPFHVSDETFRLVRCGTCDTYVLNPRPPMSEMGAFYGEAFLADTSAPKESFIMRLAAKQQELNLVSERRWLDKHLTPSANYPDYSAGNGQIVDLVRTKRPDTRVFATEFSKEYRDWIAGRIGPERVHESLDAFDADLRFDLISAFGVLEHVEDPRELLRALSSRLAVGGKMMLSIPNIDAVQRILMGERWYSWLAPRHWHLMKVGVLKKLLEQNGLRIVDEKHFFFRTTSSTFVLSLFPGLDPLLSTSSLKLFAYAALFYLFLPLELVAAAFSRAGFVGVVAEKM